MATINFLHPAQRRTFHVALICLFISLATIILNILTPWGYGTFMLDAERYVYDHLVRVGRPAAVNPNLVFIGIDQPSYEDLIFPEDAKDSPALAALRTRFPWSRIVWAKVISQLCDAGAKTVVIDLFFSSPSDGDDELRAALEKYHDHVVIGSLFSPVETDRGVVDRLTPPSPTLIDDQTNLPASLDPRVGFVNIFADVDGKLRQSRYQGSNHFFKDAANTSPNSLLYSLDARALQSFGTGDRIPKLNGSQMFIRFAGPPGTWKVIPLANVLTPKIWEKNFGNGSFFKDKLVLIGPTANIFQDYHRTPFSDDMSGPEIHLNLINAALQKEFLPNFPTVGKVALLMFSGLLATVLCVSLESPLHRTVPLLLTSGLIYGTARWAYSNQVDSNSLALPVVGPWGILLTCGLATLLYDFFIERLEKMKLRHTMGLYFSPRVLDAVLAKPGSMKPKRAEVLLLLTDLRNSTPLAEKLGPAGMFKLLNAVFEVQTNAIMSEEGNLEHFLGDQFLSYWGAPQPQPDAGPRAIKAAMKLIEGMEKLRANLPPDINALFGYGVALHGGQVLVGNKGSALRLDYGLVGDAVNEASRVEALTKYYGVKLLITRNAIARLEDQGVHRLLDRVIVKGKSEPVELFELENPCTSKDYRDICKRYRAAFDLYHFGEFAKALPLFKALDQEFADKPSHLMAGRCEDFIQTPPIDWHGVWKMDAK